MLIARMWLSDCTVAEHIHGSPQTEARPVRRPRAHRSRWYAAPFCSLCAGELTVRTVMFWSRKKSIARKMAGRAAYQRYWTGSAHMSTSHGLPPLSSKDRGIARRVKPPRAEGTRSESAETPQMTSGGPKSDTSSRIGSERNRLERKAAVLWRSHAVSVAVLRASHPEAADAVVTNSVRSERKASERKLKARRALKTSSVKRVQ
mmetsp:Transcript_4471/g.9761  ORF Transcript_4471/g.9761 Transcript_4471/m.9761 type:complete len:204 (+) Transcript_4471:859-1470(+)